MTKPLTTFTDAQLGVVEILRNGLADRDETYVGTPTVSTKIPTTKIPGTSLPFVLVRQDAAFPRYPVDEQTTVRVTVYHRAEDLALQLAKLCRALICSSPGTDLIRATRALTGPFPTSDPDTGEPVATLTVRAHTRPVSAA